MLLFDFVLIARRFDFDDPSVLVFVRRLEDFDLDLDLLLVRSGIEVGTMYGFCLFLIMYQIICQIVRGFFVGFTVGRAVTAVVIPTEGVVIA